MSDVMDDRPLTRTTSQALESWDRILAKVVREQRAVSFNRAATEILRLASRENEPEDWQQLIDAVYEMGIRHELSDAVVQTLMDAATQAGPDRRSGEPLVAEIGDNGAPPVDTADAFVAYAVAAHPMPLALISPPAWRDVPLEAMRWLATNRVPAGDVTLLSGDGGGGKTTVAVQLAVSVERGLGDWLGTTCESGPVIFFSGEEPEAEMRRRLHRIARKRGIEPSDLAGLHFHFADPDACLLGVARRDNGTMTPTPLFDALASSARKIRPALIVVDSIAATFGGNQNDRVHARTFVGMFRTLARTVDCAILLLDHPSLSGITSGTGRGGSMDWQNATRARLHLETVQNADGTTGRVLEVKKTNYGPSGEKVALQWEDGSFVMERSSTGQTTPHRAAAQRTTDNLFLSLLDERNAQGRWVTPSKAAGYAPKELATMPGAGTTTAMAFAQAMERLLSANCITVETFGPPSKQRQRLITTNPNGD